MRPVKAAALVAAVIVVSCQCAPTRRALIAVADPGYRAQPEEVVAAAAPGIAKVRLDAVVKSLPELTEVVFLPGSSTKMVALLKRGAAYQITLHKDGDTLREKERALLFRVDVRTQSELGLLGIAFHPDFAHNGRFFVHYNPRGDKIISRVEAWQYDAKTQKAKAHHVVLETEQPYQNHDGGRLAFGPDGYLYIAFGDGGWRADPHENGQNAATWLGSILRVDIDQAPYAVPKDNPFVHDEKKAPEVYVYGLRNPWKFSFTDDGALIIADVGQDKYEEVDVAVAGDNLGWNDREGAHCFDPPTGCETGFVEPVFEYGRDLGQSITGGYLYHGTVEGLRGKYIVGDFVSGRIWALTLAGKGKAESHELGKWPALISTFGQSADGEIFVGSYGEGVLYQIVAE